MTKYAHDNLSNGSNKYFNLFRRTASLYILLLFRKGLPAVHACTYVSFSHFRFKTYLCSGSKQNGSYKFLRPADWTRATSWPTTPYCSENWISLKRDQSEFRISVSGHSSFLHRLLSSYFQKRATTQSHDESRPD